MNSLIINNIFPSQLTFVNKTVKWKKRIKNKELKIKMISIKYKTHPYLLGIK